MGCVQSSHDDRVEVLEAAIASSLNAQDADIALIVPETQADKGEKQIIITERERHIAAVHDAGRLHLEELRRELADIQYELAVVASPILALPHEIMEEVFQWHAWRGQDLRILLLVCKRWTAIAYASPRLWSRIHLGSQYYRSLNQLRLFLSRSQSAPLQILVHYPNIESGDVAPTSLWHKSLGRANRIEAIKLILSNEILRRCTSITFGNDPIPPDDLGYQVAVEAMTVLPLLSLIRIPAGRLKKHEIRVIQSLARCSPSLRLMYCRYGDMSPLALGADSWAKRIETYGWVYTHQLCRSLQESPSLRYLRMVGPPVVPLTLLAVQKLRWRNLDFPGYPFITAPQLHTLIAHYGPGSAHPPAGSITLPNLRISMHFEITNVMVLRVFHTPALEHLSISPRPSASLLTNLLQVFDGSGHMPTPNSLHLHCTFTDTALIAILRRLPQLEELRVSGRIPQEAFWEALTPPCNLNMRSRLLESYLDVYATDILLPKLQVLLVDNSQYIDRFQLSGDDRKAFLSKSGEWTVAQASAAAVARERAGCPLKTLACWSPERKIKELIGSLKSLPRRPECVLFIALWCR